MATVSLPMESPSLTVPVQRPAARRWNPFGWILRLLAIFLPRRLTPEEKAERAARLRLKKALEAKYAQLDQEARHYADTISRTLANHGVAAIEKVKGEREVKRYVRYRGKFYANEEQIHLRVDTRPGKLPFGIGLDRLEDPEVLRLLGINCRHRVRTRWTEDGGFWLVIDRKFGVGGLPTHVQFEEVMALRPANARALSIPLGCAERKKYPWKSFDTFYNMLVCGTVGSGKSRFLHSMICALLRYNPANRVQFMLIDLKGGVEFTQFYNLEHVMKIKWLKPKKKKKAAETDEELAAEAEQLADCVEDGFEEDAGEPRPAIVEKREDVPAAFAWLIREGERRLELLKKRGVTNIGLYNQHRPEEGAPYLSHIITFIDEWADVKLSPKTGKLSEEMLINISSRFRAAGIHVVVCTQSPNKDVLGLRVRNVLPVRMVFQCPDIYTSQMLIGDQRAAEINHPGRGYFVQGNEAAEIQTPFINDETISEYLAQALSGNVVGVKLKAHDVSDLEVLRWAYYENQGYMDYRTVYEHFKDRRVTQKEAMRLCAKYENREVDIDGELFTVVPGTRNPPTPRRIMPVKT